MGDTDKRFRAFRRGHGTDILETDEEKMQLYPSYVADTATMELAAKFLPSLSHTNIIGFLFLKCLCN